LIKNYIFPLLLLSTIVIAQNKGGHWQFENNGDDTAVWDQTANTGEPVNQAAYGAETPLQERSYYLNLDPDVTASFRIPDNHDLDFANENIAISMWIYPLGFSTTQFLITKGIQNTNPKSNNYALRLEASSGKLSFLIRAANNQARVVTSTFSVPTNEWTFVAVFYDYTNEKVYFWNSMSTLPVDTVAYAEAFFPNDGPLEIGSWYTSDGAGVKHFAGRIDDIKLSSRLTDAIPGADLAIEDHPGYRASNNPGSIGLYPNPVSLSGNRRGLTIQLNAVHEPSTLIVYNLLGQEMLREVVWGNSSNSLVQWPIADLVDRQFSTGIYFIVRQKPGGLAVRKFTIVK